MAQSPRGARYSLVAVLSALPMAAGAHHGDAGRYEDTLTEIRGTVVEFTYVNPHATLVLDAADSSGKVERWTAEMGPPGFIARRGLTPTTVRVGDVIAVSGRRRKNGEPYLTISGGGGVFDAAGRPLYGEN